MKRIIFLAIVLLFVFGMMNCKTDPEKVAKETACNEAYEQCADEAGGDDAALILCEEARQQCLEEINK
ncbi:MAG: hypothetical protein JW822_13585 [Spirochaetales bacterium]|nr:hypothetical protein [Spirochaetales bacterium]